MKGHKIRTNFTHKKNRRNQKGENELFLGNNSEQFKVSITAAPLTQAVRGRINRETNKNE